MRLGQGSPARLSIAKSAEVEKASAAQQSAKQLSQSARRLARSDLAAGWSAGMCFSGTGHLLPNVIAPLLAVFTTTVM
jgi:hypothetical protein